MCGRMREERKSASVYKGSPPSGGVELVEGVVGDTGMCNIQMKVGVGMEGLDLTGLAFLQGQ